MGLELYDFTVRYLILRFAERLDISHTSKSVELQEYSTLPTYELVLVKATGNHDVMEYKSCVM